MAVRKFAISVAEEVMVQVEQAAAERGETRSAFINRVLRRVATARSDAEIRRRINRFFADEALQRHQREEAEVWSAAATDQGTEW
jgi:metal-responsive CopG/Arc/MetJ family transcriptional regulator